MSPEQGSQVSPVLQVPMVCLVSTVRSEPQDLVVAQQDRQELPVSLDLRASMASMD